ncbi:MAG: methionyl-tRNA formyltransferase, partial [Deltaproteobacteria bacterium]|nr:methionyl-tRNA formyltransferase [Deltaproteobacteria bacterium]
KKRALELGLEVWQPKKVRTAEFAEKLRALDADVAVVVAYGRILPRAVLDAPRTGCVNVHASLLPRWRGAAPIQWSIVHGDEQTGVTLMQVDEGMDSGAILARASTPIAPDDDAATLSDRLQ